MTTKKISLEGIMSSDDIDLSRISKPSEGVIIATATNLKDLIASDDIDL